MKKRINYNDLIPYLFRDHKELPEKYIKSCESFFESIGIKTKGASDKSYCRTCDNLTKQQVQEINRKSRDQVTSTETCEVCKQQAT